MNWRVSDLPTLRIGEADGQPQYTLDEVRGVVEWPDSGIVVIDGGSLELRWFDRLGQWVRSTGRAGRGPGEFGALQWVRSHFRDSIFVYDARQRRLTRFGIDGRLAGVTDRLELSNSLPVGALSDKLLTYWTVFRVVSDTDRPYMTPAEYWLYDRENQSIGELAASSGTMEFVVWEQNAALGRYRSMYAFPFDIMPAAAVGEERIFMTDGEAPEVRVYDVEGLLRQIWRVDDPGREVTEADVERFVDAMVSQADDPDAVRAGYANVESPEHMPLFESLIVDGVGWLWAATYDMSHAPPHAWVVFDSSGVARGTVHTPEGLEIHQIGRDFILGVERDELGVERVVRYGLGR
jgi:6-bladed beta-propeller